MYSSAVELECGRVKTGTHEQAMERFLAEVERRAFFTARLATRHEQDAMDIVQDAMLSLVRSYANRPCEEWPALFNRILHNRMMDWHRQQSRQRRWMFWERPDWDDEESADWTDQLANPRDENPARLLEHARDMETVKTALEQLPFRQQQAFLLRIWEGLDIAATAQIMQCSEGSVKTHLFRALASMRKALGDQNVSSAKSV